ncbi:MAG TPA: TIR domain-containing protein [Bradyrhizobium sp.]|nr:TIR domain-containing protein [Bradyrhizobium sp.]
MSSLADLPDLAGFFSYSRRDDEDSDRSLSDLRKQIHRELRTQLGFELKLWQDTEAIPGGTEWETEIKKAISRSVFFIPIVTPSSVASRHCRLEFEAFLDREQALGRSNLVFPLLYVRVPALEREEQWRQDPLLAIIGRRQHTDWQKFRHRSLTEAEPKEKIEQFCRDIVESLRESWISPEEQARREKERLRADAESRERAEQERRDAKEAEAKRTAERARRDQEEQERLRKKQERRRQILNRIGGIGSSPIVLLCGATVLALVYFLWSYTPTGTALVTSSQAIVTAPAPVYTPPAPANVPFAPSADAAATALLPINNFVCAFYQLPNKINTKKVTVLIDKELDGQKDIIAQKVQQRGFTLATSVMTYKPETPDFSGAVSQDKGANLIVHCGRSRYAFDNFSKGRGITKLP